LPQGGAPKESDSFYIDLNWGYPISFGSHLFSVEGHAEYIGDRTNEFGKPVSHWYFSQIQFRYYLNGTSQTTEHAFLGAEWQIWVNKLGDPDTDENALQLLLGWRF
jgi:hypothetical protein